MSQKPLFYDDWKDACRVTINDSGKPYKEVALHLRPEMKMESAYAWIKDCLKDGGEQKLDFGQVVALMRFCGQFDPLYHACDELEHARPVARAPGDELAVLQRAYISAAGEMKKIAERIERVSLRATG